MNSGFSLERTLAPIQKQQGFGLGNLDVSSGNSDYMELIFSNMLVLSEAHERAISTIPRLGSIAVTAEANFNRRYTDESSRFALRLGMMSFQAMVYSLNTVHPSFVADDIERVSKDLNADVGSASFVDEYYRKAGFVFNIATPDTVKLIRQIGSTYHRDPNLLEQGAAVTRQIMIDTAEKSILH